MFGIGILRGLSTTARHLLETYLDDVKRIPSRYAFDRRLVKQPVDEEGIFTIQYPEEKRLTPENFRYVPMLLFDAESGQDRCTACGICAKVCPPQCIWIVRDQDEKGKPIPRPAEFYIDISICMGCGYCAEFCPFDAIKMNHDYEIAVYDRHPSLVLDKDELSVPTTYYAQLYPTAWLQEEKAREEEEKKKAAKAAAAARRRAERAQRRAKTAPGGERAASAAPKRPPTAAAPEKKTDPAAQDPPEEVT